MAKDYYNIDEAALILDVERTTIYARMRMLGIKGVKFPGNRRTYLTREQFVQIKTLYTEPWKVEEREKGDEKGRRARLYKKGSREVKESNPVGA